MKIYLYNPRMVKRVCELLQSGAVMNKMYQPHEGHIPYLLQLFIDFNLYGMNLLNLGAVKFRSSHPKVASPAVSQEDTLLFSPCWRVWPFPGLCVVYRLPDSRPPDLQTSFSLDMMVTFSLIKGGLKRAFALLH
ncbi:DNA polymerase zeta catalytic subunit-like isoform X1 [Notothenia coriiceps]|uniref:DNA polymerase zeta catalytic subunit-like isoform X1 n=1 Tax=Notothenia coriiceps TaxID=8208 RepID=A0A6I9MPY7_9TELE|nr:PREDICTED: DNA polymerase zeta catalytic subunit-like isoform X1 [Notothenia coriiceps]